MPPKRKYMTSHSSDTLSDTSSDLRPMPRKKRQRFHPSRQEVASSEQTSPPSAQLLELRSDHQRFSPSTSLSQETRAQSQQNSSDTRQQPLEDLTPDQVELRRIRENVRKTFVPFIDQISPFLKDAKVSNEDKKHLLSTAQDIRLLVEQAKQQDLEKLHKVYNDTLHTILDLEMIVKNEEIEKICRDFILKPDLLLQGFQTSDDSSRAEQDPLTFTSIQNLSEKFIEVAQRPKLPQGQRHSPLRINLTDAQYRLVCFVLRQSLNDKTIDKKIHKKAKNAAYNATPQGKAQKAAYNATPQIKAQKAAYNATPQGKARLAAYKASPRAKARQAAYQATPRVKARQAAYQATPQSKARQAAYQATPQGKATRAAYQATPQRKAYMAAYMARKREEALAARRDGDKQREQPAAKARGSGSNNVSQNTTPRLTADGSHQHASSSEVRHLSSPTSSQHQFQDALPARDEQVPDPIQKKRSSQPRKPSDERINRLISEVRHLSSPTSSQHQSERLDSISPEFAQNSSETMQQPREDHTLDQVEMIRKNVIEEFVPFRDQISPFLKDAKVSDEERKHLLSTEHEIRSLIELAKKNDVSELCEMYVNTLINIDCLEMLVDDEDLENCCRNFIDRMNSQPKDHQTHAASSNTE